jgi:DNA-binding CsgD family transcriptional regulator
LYLEFFDLNLTACIKVRHGCTRLSFSPHFFLDTISFVKRFLQPVSIVSSLIILIGVGLFELNIVSRGQYNIAAPLIFVVLAGGFFILIFRFREEWDWIGYLYIPAFLLTAFAIIFTLNVLTQDWKSWAYAWILLLAGIGVGGIFTSKGRNWPKSLQYSSWGLAIAGFTFFGVFGVIAGGTLIQIVAPLLLIGAGFGVRLLKPAATPESASQSETKTLDAQVLSQRETEVIQLIAKGLTNQQIALRLSVAESTIKTHINNIYTKLGTQSRVQAVNQARQQGLINE